MEPFTGQFLKEIYDGRLIIRETNSGKTIFDFDEPAAREVYISTHQITVKRADTRNITVIPVRETVKIEGY